MLNLFKKKSEKEKLQDKYKKLIYQMNIELLMRISWLCAWFVKRPNEGAGRVHGSGANSSPCRRRVKWRSQQGGLNAEAARLHSAVVRPSAQHHASTSPDSV